MEIVFFLQKMYCENRTESLNMEIVFFLQKMYCENKNRKFSNLEKNRKFNDAHS
jgi:hypothetical protein